MIPGSAANVEPPTATEQHLTVALSAGIIAKMVAARPALDKQ